MCELEGIAELEDKIRKPIDSLRRELGSDSRSLEQEFRDVDGRIRNYFDAIGECRARRSRASR